MTHAVLTEGMTPAMRTSFDEMLGADDVTPEPAAQPDPVIATNRSFVASLVDAGLPVPAGVPRS